MRFDMATNRIKWECMKSDISLVMNGELEFHFIFLVLHIVHADTEGQWELTYTPVLSPLCG